MRNNATDVAMKRDDKQHRMHVFMSLPMVEGISVTDDGTTPTVKTV